MDLKQIAMFALLPFRRRSRQRGQRLPHPPVCSLVRLYASELGDRQLGNRRVPDALPGLVAITRDPYITIILISIGGFGHQIISCMLSALVVESFDKGQMATVNGMRGSAAWIASFLFSLIGDRRQNRLQPSIYRHGFL